MSDYADHMRAKVEASARASVAFARASAWGRLYDVASRLAAYLGAYGTVEAKSELGSLLLNALRGIDGDNYCPGLMPASPPLPDGWREVIKRARNSLGCAGGVGVAGAHNAEIELSIGNPLLDMVEEEMESLASPPLAARPVGALSLSDGIEGREGKALLIDACYIGGDAPFICGAWGKISGHVMEAIEKDLAETVQEGMIFTRGDGVYRLEARHEPGQYGEFGRCEFPPYWDCTEVAFTPLASDQSPTPAHVCGLQGFGRGADWQNDVCPACESASAPAPASQRELLRECEQALWVCAEHDALHFGESRNTAIQARATLAKLREHLGERNG